MGLHMMKKRSSQSNKNIIVQDYLGTIENLFQFENEKGHEIIFVYKATFADLKDFYFKEIIVNDKGRNSSVAVWRSIEEIKAEKSKLYPDGLEELLEKL